MSNSSIDFIDTPSNIEEPVINALIGNVVYKSVLTIKIDKVDENPSLLMNNKVDRHRNETASDNIEIASKANV